MLLADSKSPAASQLQFMDSLFEHHLHLRGVSGADLDLFFAHCSASPLATTETNVGFVSSIPFAAVWLVVGGILEFCGIAFARYVGAFRLLFFGELVAGHDRRRRHEYFGYLDDGAPLLHVPQRAF